MLVQHVHVAHWKHEDDSATKPWWLSLSMCRCPAAAAALLGPSSCHSRPAPGASYASYHGVPGCRALVHVNHACTHMPHHDAYAWTMAAANAAQHDSCCRPAIMAMAWQLPGMELHPITHCEREKYIGTLRVCTCVCVHCIQ